MKNVGRGHIPFGWAGPAAGGGIFQIIKEQGPISRTRLVEITGLAKSTITLHVDKLLDLGLIIEDLGSDPITGRKQKELRFAFDAGYTIGIDLGVTSLDVALCNLGSEIISLASEKLTINLEPKTILDKIFSAVNKLLHENNLESKQITGIGMGFPGPVEFSTGRPVAPPIMPHWDLYPLAENLIEKYKCPVFVDNDVNMMAVGERHSGIAKDIENVLFIKVGTGIGAGIICDGELYRGSLGCAGDIGHISVEGVEEGCPCGNIGCLEAVAGGPAVATRATNAAKNQESELLYQLWNEKGIVTAEDVGELAERGDLVCLEIIRESGRMVGKVLSKLVNFYNPSIMVIGGGLSNYGDRFLASIREVIYRRSTPLATRDLTIQRSVLKSQAGVIGASVTAVDELFSQQNVAIMVSEEESLK